jgi:hypothetical protein
MKIKPFYRPVVPSILCFGIYLHLIKKKKMTDFIPYFAGIITVLFGVAFAYALTNTGKKDDELQKKLKTVRIRNNHCIKSGWS